MKNVLFLGSLSLKKNRLDGVTVKSRNLVEWLNDKSINLTVVDTDNWGKRIIEIVYKTISQCNQCDAVIICAADRGAYWALKLLNVINFNKPIYYFVAGGRLADRIESGKYKKSIYDICKKIYVESKDMDKKLFEVGVKNSMTLNNFRKFDKNNEIIRVGTTVKCVYFGRVIEEKGISDAINIVNNVIDKGYDINFDIYGQISDEYYNKIKSTLNSKIKYCGYIDNSKQSLQKIIKDYDILLFPTKYEGECLPGTLIEAYIGGLAIIASNWRYAKEYIPENKVGKIFNFNDLNDFENKLENLLQNKKIINDFKKNSKEESLKYHSDLVLNGFLDDLLSK